MYLNAHKIHAHKFRYKKRKVEDFWKKGLRKYRLKREGKKKMDEESRPR